MKNAVLKNCKNNFKARILKIKQNSRFSLIPLNYNYTELDLILFYSSWLQYWSSLFALLKVCLGHTVTSTSCSSSVSHSVMSEMQVIEQETPVGTKSSSRSKLDLFDEPGFTSGPPKCVELLHQFVWFLTRDKKKTKPVDLPDTRTTRLQQETVLDPGGTLREAVPPSPPGPWRRRSPKRRWQSPVFSRSERGIYTARLLRRVFKLSLKSFSISF